MTTPAPTLPIVHCWRIDLDAPRPAGSDQWIAASEHARADRFKFDYLQRRYRATRAGLRMLLARALGIQPGEVRFVRSARGKPSLDPAHQSDLQFNLTHSEHVAWVAVGTMELGIDLEVLGRQVKMLDSLLHRVTTPDEDGLLMAMPEALRELAFLLMWTRKESALKAWGEGISGMGSLNTLETRLPDTDVLGRFLQRLHPAHVEAGTQGSAVPGAGSGSRAQTSAIGRPAGTEPDAPPEIPAGTTRHAFRADPENTPAAAIHRETFPADPRNHPAGAHPVPAALTAATDHRIPANTLPQVHMVYPRTRAAELKPGEQRPALYATTLDLGSELVTVTAPEPFEVQAHAFRY
ncbi:4'-phosphopantetheinyl transferase family protein [Lautropia dentalis]|nr:4'-phosphopantetheinyl transferase superfamily protein [Lautropia dentalis]